ncbi:Nucleolar protein 56 [Trichoplax sp. H2]|nr:Nucleolar protein 56 [Trichoplax sp. H2]|eukprot:RDD41947.1 Nucleolar protein 56 [Trichoplax sp. H2]
MVLYLLFEHASGYAIFQSLAQEEIGALTAEVQESILDLGRFGKLIKLVAFTPFRSSSNALENINSVSEGIAHDDLKAFLLANIPVGKKKTKVVLGISDSKLASAVQESVKLSCQSGELVLELIRGIRVHFHKFIEGLSADSAGKAQLGLGHSYSRAKVKFNVNRVDNMIIQSINLLDQMDKDINTFSMRVREWYSYHFPELIKIVSDNYIYVKLVKLIKNRKELTDASIPTIEEITMDSAQAKAILDASRSSMGMDISPVDLINIERFANRVVELADYRSALLQYLKQKMENIAPNLSCLVGELVGARLISHAGSLSNLAKYPASTVQILGAEKALFRALKTRGNTPKYGLLFHSSFIGRASKKNKGRISRYLANKCSIASRIDCFTETTSSVFGNKLREQVEDRLKFYDSGEAPKKNVDVMREALQEVSSLQESKDISKNTVETPSSEKKKKKKKSKEKNRSDMEISTSAEPTDSVVDDESKKSKKKKRKSDQGDVEEADTVTKKKKKLSTGVVKENSDPSESAKKKKKKSKAS